MAARVFISYSHRDEELRNQLEVQLAMLRRQGLIDIWHDRRMLPGDHLDWTISQELDEADIVLLLVSPDFLASDYCYKIEKGRALERHKDGTARLISVILRPCDWTHTDLKKYLVTPKDGKAITQWPDRDEAFLNVAQSIRQAIEKIGKGNPHQQTHEFIERTLPDATHLLPRSSNLRLKKTFTRADEENFLLEAFEYVDRYFQGSLQELNIRNIGIQTRHRRIDANCFTGTIYQNGEKRASCTVRIAGRIEEIRYSNGDDATNEGYNESLSVGKDDQKLFLHPMGIGHFRLNRDSTLSYEGAAEYLWALL